MVKKLLWRVSKWWAVSRRHILNHLAARNPSTYLQNAQAELKATEKAGGYSGWHYRTEQILACPDLAKLTNVSDAGELKPGYQVMHNGIKVPLGSYYGRITAAVFKQTKGVHEPQEEFAFQVLLKNLGREPGPFTMMELGAYWGFYSAWFKKALPSSRTILVEPVWENMQFGRKTFALNGFETESIRALVSDSYVHDRKLPTVSLPWLMDHFQLQQLDLLHSDIQGFETHMLEGASQLLQEGRIRVAFISTHTEEAHQFCLEKLQHCGMIIGVDLPQRDSYAYDGLVVAVRPSDTALLEGMTLSRRSEHYETDERKW